MIIDTQLCSGKWKMEIKHILHGKSSKKIRRQSQKSEILSLQSN